MRSSSRLANAYNKPIIVTSDFKLDIKVIFPIIVKNWEASRSCATLSVKSAFWEKKIWCWIESIQFVFITHYFRFWSREIPFLFPFQISFRTHMCMGKSREKQQGNLETREKGWNAYLFLITCREERCSKREGKFTTETFEKVRKCDKNLMKLA